MYERLMRCVYSQENRRTSLSAGTTKTATLTVTPPSSGPLPAPNLLNPPADARFSPGQSITFDWSDVSGAANYTLQINDSNSFTAPLIRA